MVIKKLRNLINNSIVLLTLMSGSHNGFSNTKMARLKFRNSLSSVIAILKSCHTTSCVIKCL